MATDNYYDILGISPEADADSIRGAIRKTRSRYRQVAGSPNKEQARNAEVMIEKLAEAEATLLDPEARKAYDAQLSAQPAPSVDRSPVSGSSDWIETAKSYLANGQPRNAAQAAKEATRAEPNSVDAWTVRAYAALELKDHRDADFAASEAQKRDPQNPQTAGLLGDVYDDEGRYAEAERAFAHAAQLDPQNPYWRGRVAWSVSDQGRPQEAVQLAQQMLTHFPDDETAKSTYAIMLLKDAEAALSVAGDGIYYTNPRQIAHVEERLNVVRQVGAQSENVIGWYHEASQLLAGAKKRRFIWPGAKPVVLLTVYALCFVWIFLWICTSVLGDVLGTLVWLAANAGVAYWLFTVTFPLQWHVNRRALGPAARTGLQ